MPVHYTSEAAISPELLAELFKASGIRRPIDDINRLRRMLDGANLLATAWDGDLLVGVARALTDYCYCCYLSDLAIHHEYQHQGIGSELIQFVHRAVGDECTLLLVSAPTATAFYEKIGLEPITGGWMIRRKK